MTKLEEVARAIEAAKDQGPAAQARAAVEALRSPPNKIVMACRDTLAYWGEDKDADDWRAIFNVQIDAILSEGE